MPDGWVDDMVEAYGLNSGIVLDFLKEMFPQGGDSDFNVRVGTNIWFLQNLPSLRRDSSSTTPTDFRFLRS